MSAVRFGFSFFHKSIKVYLLLKIQLSDLTKSIFRDSFGSLTICSIPMNGPFRRGMFQVCYQLNPSDPENCPCISELTDLQQVSIQRFRTCLQKIWTSWLQLESSWNFLIYRVLGNCGPKVFANCSENMSASNILSLLGACQMWSIW